VITVEHEHGHGHHLEDGFEHALLLEILTAKFMSAGLSRDEAKKEAYNAIYSGGLRVYTTMDTEMQAHVEDVLNRAEYYPQTIFVDREKAREAIKNLPAGAESIPAAVANTTPLKPERLPKIRATCGDFTNRFIPNKIKKTNPIGRRMLINSLPLVSTAFKAFSGKKMKRIT